MQCSAVQCDCQKEGTAAQGFTTSTFSVGESVVPSLLRLFCLHPQSFFHIPQRARRGRRPRVGGRARNDRKESYSPFLLCRHEPL